LCDPPFLLVEQDLAGLVGDVLDARRQPGAAMVSAQQLALAQLVDVAPHGLRRDRKMLGQRLDRNEAALAHPGDDLRLPGILWHRPGLPGPDPIGSAGFRKSTSRPPPMFRGETAAA